MAAVIGFIFKERFLRFQFFLDFYHFHHVIWRMKWAKKLKTKNGQNMPSGPFSHDAAQICRRCKLLLIGSIAHTLKATKQNSTLTKKIEKRRDNKVDFYFIFNQYGVYAQLWKIRKCEQESH